MISCGPSGLSRGIFSGLMGLQTGMTVNHMFDSSHKQAGITVDDNVYLVGECEVQYDEIDVAWGRSPVNTTADIALLKLQDTYCAADNMITVETSDGGKVICELRLATTIEIGQRVLIVNRFNEKSIGRIHQDRCNRRAADGRFLENVITIRDASIKSDGTCRRITEKGDSGALVTSTPKRDARGIDYVLVYGVSIGYFETDNQMYPDEPYESCTVINRLPDILSAVAAIKDQTFDFIRPRQQPDSGFFEPRR